MDKKLTNRQAIGVLDGLWSNPLFGEAHRQAFEIGIKAIKALEQEPKWIPVSERLPKDDDYKPCIYNIDDGAVLWQDSKGNIGLGWYYNSTGVWADLDDHCPKNKVIAWMPLPEPMQTDKEI